MTEITRRVRSGAQRRLVPCVYTSNNKDSDEARLKLPSSLEKGGQI